MLVHGEHVRSHSTVAPQGIGSKKPAPSPNPSKMILKTPDDAQGNKTPSPGPAPKHVSFEITMTQAKELFMKQMTRVQHKAEAKEHFDTDTPVCKHNDLKPIVSTNTLQPHTCPHTPAGMNPTSAMFLLVQKPLNISSTPVHADKPTNPTSQPIQPI